MLPHDNALMLLAVTSQLLQPGIVEGVPVPGRGLGTFKVPSNPKSMILGLIAWAGEIPKERQEKSGKE